VLKHTKSRRVWLALSVSALALTACGGAEAGSDDDSLPVVENVEQPAESTVTTTPGGGDGGEASRGDPAASDDEAVLEWAQCMRDNGIDIEDPTVDANGNVQLGRPSGNIDPQSGDVRAAAEACSGLLEGTTFGANRGGRFDQIQEAFLAFTECLRDEGLDVGDIDLASRAGAPGEGQGGGQAGAPGNGTGEGLTAERLEGVIPGLDAKDPATQPAIDVCRPALVEAFDGLGLGG
jgi:hypothetical protein